MPGLSILIHGGPKIGKSWLASTTPGPRLILDAEGGSEWLPVNHVKWDPTREAVPAHDESWDSCIVDILSFAHMERAFQVLNSGDHPFRSVVIDSISEVQSRLQDAVVGPANPLKTQDWGEVLRKLSALVRAFRDLLRHPVKPLDVVMVVAMSREIDGKAAPYLQGQLGNTVSYYFDLVGYLVAYPDPDRPGHLKRSLMIQPDPRYVSGERLNGVLGNWVDIVEGDRNAVYSMWQKIQSRGEQ